MRYLLITIVLLTQLCTAQETWVPLDGPQEGDIELIERDSAGTLYAGRRGRVDAFFKSTDNGESWKQVKAGGLTQSLAIDRSGNLYMALSNMGGTPLVEGLVYSSDGGESWTMLRPVDDARLVSVAPDGSIFFARSTTLTRRNVGETSWRNVSINPQTPAHPANQIQRLAWHPDGELFAGTLAGVYRASSSGTGWTRVSTGLADTLVRELTFVGSDLYVGSDSALWRSSDKGGSWQRVDINGISPVVLAGSSAANVMVGTRDAKLHRSSDGGTTWQTADTPDLFFRALGRGKDATVIAGSVMYGTWLSSDNGASWRRSIRGMNNGYVVTLAIAPDGTMFAGLRGTYTGMFLTSTDGGRNWAGRQVSPAPAPTWCSAALPDGSVLMGTEGTGIYRSSDKGATWSQQNSGLTNLVIRSIAVRPNGEVLAGTEGKGLFLSKDGGRTWQPTSLDTRQVWAVTIHPDGTILAGLEGGAIRYSTDDGVTWSDAATSGIRSDIQSFAIAPDGTIFAATFQHGAIRSIDAGRSWSTTSYQRKVQFAAAALPSGEVYIGGVGGVVRTRDNGATWDTVGGGSVRFVECLTADSSGSLYAMGGMLYRLQGASQVVSDRFDATASKQISIWPNPVAAGATVHISYDGILDSPVRIYDITGVLQATLQAEGGSLQLPDELAGGFYYCVIERDGVIVSSARFEVR